MSAIHLLAYAVAGWLLFVGLYGVATSRNLVHMVVCMTVMQSSTYILLIGVGYRENAVPPVFPNTPAGTASVDPLVQSLALTDAVVSATITALLLALVLQAHKRTGTLDPGDLRAMRG